VSFRFLSRHADVAADVAKRCACAHSADTLASPLHHLPAHSEHLLSALFSALFDFANSAHGKDCAVIYCLSGWSQARPLLGNSALEGARLWRDAVLPSTFHLEKPRPARYAALPSPTLRYTDTTPCPHICRRSRRNTSCFSRPRRRLTTFAKRGCQW